MKRLFLMVAILLLPVANMAAASAGAPGIARTVADALRNDPVLNAPIRGSVTLPETGAHITALEGQAGVDQVRISWQSSKPSVISHSDRRNGADVIRKGSVTRGAAEEQVRLTATVTTAGTPAITVPFDLTVPARPKLSETDLEAYVFAYFTADTIEGERIYFAVSEGNNALQWRELNAVKPVLESQYGTLGLRDPFIMRSAEGDRFFLLATDLSAARMGWSKATDEGSHYLKIWESTDLVNWSDQRHIKVSPPNAGMTWAPEATYDPTIDAYVVYWTSHMFEDDARTRKDDNGPQILISTTRDFRTFTPAQPWFKSADVPDLVKDQGMIDSTIFRDEDYYYRFTKVTDAEGCPSADIMAQRSKSLRATTESGAWTVVDRCIGRRAGTPEVEGPSAFIANPNDTSGFKYYVWVDHYRGIGYIPLGTNSLETPIEWTYPADFRLPKRPRHGSVLPITARERAALVDRWGIVTPEVPASSSPQAQLMDNWVVPPVVASGTRLPVPQGHEVRWAVEGAKIVDGLLINDQGAPVSVSLTGTLTLPQGDTLTKTFAVQVLGRDGQMLAAYARTPTTVREANQPSVARSLHLALGQNAADLEPLHGNYGVLFASGDYTDVDRVALRGLSDPSLFYFADGSLGVIATRVDMSGAPEATQPSHTLIFKADPKSPADFTELGLIDLRTEGAVVAPKAVWDSASKRYVVSWRDATGAAHWTTVEDMARTELRGSSYQPENRGRRTRIATEGNVGKPHSGDVATIDTALAAATGAERANGLPISAEIASALTHRFGRIVNTAARVEPVNIAAGDVTTLANVRAQLDYSDGSTATRGVDWNVSDLKRLAKARSGTHEIRGTVRQPAYPQIFAYNRADPAIHRYERDGVVKYLFIATDDTNNNNVGSPHLPLRVADSLAGLADDNGGLAREVDLLNRVTRRDRTLEGRVIAGCYWAPELHEIGGRLSILFAPCFNPTDDQSNEKGSWRTVEAHIMQLRDGGDPAKPADWSQPAAVRKADGSALGRAEFDRNISLDMSYFEANGQHYYTWSQRYISDPETMGDPLTWIARVDPSAPTRLVTEPQLIIAPSLSFEENLAEGAFAVFHSDRIHLIYSGSKVSPTYVVGGVWARTDSNLTNIDSWHKWKAPLQKSVPMPEGVTDYLTYEQGAGHGAFTTDEDGNTLYVYHSWGNGVGGNGRDTRVRRLHWAADGRPVLYMTPDEEVAPENRAVTTKVTIQ